MMKSENTNSSAVLLVESIECDTIVTTLGAVSYLDTDCRSTVTTFGDDGAS